MRRPGGLAMRRERCPELRPMRGCRRCGGRATSRSGRAGFTLIEALAAFAIVAMVAVVIQRGVVASARSSAFAADTAAAARVATTLLASPLDGLGPDAALSGTLDGHAWSLVASPLPFPAASVGPDNAKASWAPVRLRLTIDEGRGRSLMVESVRMVKVGS